MGKLLLYELSICLLKYLYCNIIIIAVIKSKIAKKYSINALILLFFTKFLITEPNAAHGDIDSGQIINAIIPIKKIEKNKFPSLGKKLDAAILDIVHALGFIN
tara:strand:- start:30 stop:338 length:309 start_codon:yes stop_codon:yes gene_type:complete